MENEFDILKTIKKVETPPFLYTRILNVVQNREKEIIPAKWILATATCLMILFTVNIWIMQTNRKKTEPDLAVVFSLKPQNMLYNE